jgi:endonuclease-3
MGRLSAQCTDARVNIVSRELFAEFPTAIDLANGDISRIEEIVKPCGLYRMKADNIREASRMLITDFGGRVPDNMDDLLKLPGVGRKIANLLLGDIYGLPAVVCDTHCMRICGRLGFYPESLRDPTKIEKILTELIEPSEGSDFCHRIVFFGREICSARSPMCENCPFSDICAHNKGAKNDR